MRLLAPKRPPICTVCGSSVRPIYYEEHTQKCKLLLEINQKLAYLSEHGRSSIDVNDCLLCSRRGLKCDESHPYCLRCQLMGGKCKWWKGRFSHTESSKKNNSFRDFESHQRVESHQQDETISQVEPLNRVEPLNQVMFPQENLPPSSQIVPRPELWPAAPDYFTDFEPHAVSFAIEFPRSIPGYVVPPPDFGTVIPDYFTNSGAFNTLSTVEYPNPVPEHSFTQPESASRSLGSTLSTGEYHDSLQDFQLSNTNGLEQFVPLSQGVFMSSIFPFWDQANDYAFGEEFNH